MKLAEALQERADLRRKVDMLAERLEQNAFTQEGDEPAEDPHKLLDELETTCARLERFISAINRTNSATLVGGQTITELLAQKDCLGMRIHVLRNLTSKAGGSRMLPITFFSVWRSAVRRCVVPRRAGARLRAMSVRAGRMTAPAPEVALS